MTDREAAHWLPRVLLWALGAWLLLASLRRYACALLDDAFISFQFARNLAEGHGLVWNPGELPVEGASNLSLVALLALAHTLGVDLSLATRLIALASVAGCALGCYALARRLGAGQLAATLVAAVWLARPETALHASTGLETHLIALLLVWLVLLLEPDTGRSRLAIVFVYLALVLTRPEAGLVGGAALLSVYLWARYAQPESARERLVVGISCAGALACVLLAKLVYFGTLVSPPMLIKGGSSLRAGLPSVIGFGLAFLPIFCLAAFDVATRRLSPARVAATVASAALLGFFSFVTPVMADGHRYLYPVLPLLLALAAGTLERLLWLLSSKLRPVAAAASVLLLAPGALLAPDARSLDLSRVLLAAPMRRCEETWTGRDAAIGRAFGALGQRASLRLALEDVGAMTFHSRATTLDLVGLVDREIAASRSEQAFLDAVAAFSPDAILMRTLADGSVPRGHGGHGALGRFGKQSLLRDSRFARFERVRDLESGDPRYRWTLWVRPDARARFARLQVAQ